MAPIKAAHLSIVILAALYLILSGMNPFGWNQRIEWGMKPPFHWVQQDMTAHTEGSFDEEYVGVNGKSCAAVYRFGSTDLVRVYGYGFAESFESRAAAEAKAAQECR